MSKLPITDPDSLYDEIYDEIESLRQQLAASQKREAAALAACKLKDESLEAAHNGLRWWMDAFPLHVTEADNEEMLKIVKALAIQPDDAALKAWLGEPHSYLYKFNSEFGDGTFWSHRPTHNGADALETIPLYKPKELK